MFVFERVGAEDALIASSSDPVHDPALPPASFDVDVPPNEIDRARSPYRDPDPNPDPDEARVEEAAREATAARHGRARSRSIKLRPAARDAYLLLEDLCLLVAGSVEGGPDGEPSFLRWKSLSRTFGLELVESIVSGFGEIVRSVRTLSPCLVLLAFCAVAYIGERTKAKTFIDPCSTRNCYSYCGRISARS